MAEVCVCVCLCVRVCARLGLGCVQVWWCQPKVDIVVAESSLGAKLLREDHAIKLDERRIESRQVLICLGGQRVAIQLPLSFHAQVLLPVGLVWLWMGGYVWLRVDMDVDVDAGWCY